MSGLLRAGCYVDVENINRNGGRSMTFSVLRDYCCRDNAEAIRLNAYLAVDKRRFREDGDYRQRVNRYNFAWRSAGFKVIEKEVQWFTDEDGNKVSKANADLMMAIDILQQAPHLDRVVLASADGDFSEVIRTVQDRGCRVEVVGFEHVSHKLQWECDLFTPGFVIPNLLPAGPKKPAWGEIGSRVRGTCFRWFPEKGYGFFRYLVGLDNLTNTNTDDATSPHREAFCHQRFLPSRVGYEMLPNRNLIFEFTLTERQREGGCLEAQDVVMVCDLEGKLNRLL